MFNLSAFLFYVFVVTFTPGPNNIMAMAAAGKFGFKKALQYSIGVFTGFFIIMLLSSYFNLLFFNVIPKVQPFMQVIGAGFMLYLAFKIITAKEETENDPSLGDHNEETNSPSLYLTAVGLQFINPKGIIYAVTVVANFIIPYYQSHLSFVLFAFLLAFISILSTASWALFGSIFNTFLSKHQRQFNWVMGLLLVYSAGSILDLF